MQIREKIMNLVAIISLIKDNYKTKKNRVKGTLILLRDKIISSKGKM